MKLASTGGSLVALAAAGSSATTKAMETAKTTAATDRRKSLRCRSPVGQEREGCRQLIGPPAFQVLAVMMVIIPNYDDHHGRSLLLMRRAPLRRAGPDEPRIAMAFK